MSGAHGGRFDRHPPSPWQSAQALPAEPALLFHSAAPSSTQSMAGLPTAAHAGILGGPDKINPPGRSGSGRGCNQASFCWARVIRRQCLLTLQETLTWKFKQEPQRPISRSLHITPIRKSRSPVSEAGAPSFLSCRLPLPAGERIKSVASVRTTMNSRNSMSKSCKSAPTRRPASRPGPNNWAVCLFPCSRITGRMARSAKPTACSTRNGAWTSARFLCSMPRG